MALAGALCATLLAVTGITNKSLCALMTGLLHAPYTSGQTTYDLRRPPHRRASSAGSSTPTGTSSRPTASACAVFYTKLHNRLLRPLMACQPPSPARAHAMPCSVIDRQVNDYVTRARLGTSTA